MATNELKIDLDIDDNLKGALTTTCPECKKKTKKKLLELSPGKEISCSCGVTFSFSGDEAAMVLNIPSGKKLIQTKASKARLPMSMIMPCRASVQATDRIPAHQA